MDSESTFQVNLPAFRGPLELLLLLVQRNELALGEVPLETVAEQFADHLRAEGRNLEAVGDFVLQAATLLEIKSRALLPQPPEDTESFVQAKPTEWVRHLLEYQHYRELADTLGRLEEAQRLTRSRPLESCSPMPRGPGEPRVSVTDLVAAFDRVLRSATRVAEVPAAPLLSPEQCREQILAKVNGQSRVAFGSLFEPRMPTLDRVAIFLTLLQMVKDGHLRLEQEAPLGNLWVLPADVQSEDEGLTKNT